MSLALIITNDTLEVPKSDFGSLISFPFFINQESSSFRNQCSFKDYNAISICRANIRLYLRKAVIPVMGIWASESGKTQFQVPLCELAAVYPWQII